MPINYGDELALKALTLTEQYIAKEERGAMSPVELEIRLKTILEIVGWSLPSDVSSLIGNVPIQDNDPIQFRKLFINAKGRIVQVKYAYGDYNLEVCSEPTYNGWKSYKLYDFSGEVDPVLAVFEKAEKVVRLLGETNYKELV